MPGVRVPPLVPLRGRAAAIPTVGLPPVARPTEGEHRLAPRPVAPHRAPQPGFGAHAWPPRPRRRRRVRRRRGVTGETDRPAWEAGGARPGGLRSRTHGSRRRRDRTRSRTLGARGRGVRPRRPAPPVTRRRSAARRHAARAAAARGPRRRGSVERPSPRALAPMQDPHPGARQTQREEQVPEPREGRHRLGCRRGDVDGQRVGGRAVVRAVVHREGEARLVGAGRARGRGVREGPGSERRPGHRVARGHSRPGRRSESRRRSTCSPGPRSP